MHHTTTLSPPLDPMLQRRVDALLDNTRRQLAEILSGGKAAGPRPAMLTIEDACAVLAGPFGRTASGLAAAFRRGDYPRPDLWSGSGLRIKRRIAIPAIWIDQALRDGPAAFTRPVRPHELRGYLAAWPDPMSVKTAARALGIGETTAKRLANEGVLPVTRTATGLVVRHQALAEYLARCVNEAVSEWSPAGVA